LTMMREPCHRSTSSSLSAARAGVLAALSTLQPTLCAAHSTRWHSRTEEGAYASQSNDNGTSGLNSISFTRCQNVESGSSVSTISCPSSWPSHSQYWPLALRRSR
jgi:hypothetical protein